MPKPRPLLVRAGLLALGLAGGLLLLEHGVRWTDFWGVHYYREVSRYQSNAVWSPPGAFHEQGHLFEQRPDVQLEFARFEFRTDERGLRTGAEPRSEPADALRILFLGDSVTLGWGVDDEHTWVRLVEREARAPDGRPVVALNAGHLMYDTVQEASLLRAWGPKLEPDIVLLTFIFNDLEPTWDAALAMAGLPPELPGSLPEEPAASQAPLGAWFGRHFWALSDLIRFQRDTRRLHAADEEQRRRLRPFRYYPLGWPRCAAALADVRATSEALGARLIVHDQDHFRVPELAEWCLAHGVERIATYFQPEDITRDMENSKVDPHFNAKGNRMLADRVLAELEALGALRWQARGERP